MTISTPSTINKKSLSHAALSVDWAATIVGDKKRARSGHAAMKKGLLTISNARLKRDLTNFIVLMVRLLVISRQFFHLFDVLLVYSDYPNEEQHKEYKGYKER